MAENVRVELEFVLKSTITSLENLIATPSGLAEWYADNVEVKEDIYTFSWDDTEEQARLLHKKKGSSIRWRWLSHEKRENGMECFFEFNYQVDAMTKDAVLNIVSVNPPDSNKEDISLLWEDSITDLRNVLGA